MSARIGIDLGGTKLSGVVLGAGGDIPVHLRRASPRDDYAGTLRALVDLVADLERAGSLAPGETTVGVGTPGTWQPRLGRMKNCNSTWLNDQPLLNDLEQRLGPRVRVANDADCFALSEAADGAGSGAASVFGVILGTGVGGALVVNGTLLQGPNGLAGEWGHMPLPYFRSRIFHAGADPADGALFQLESELDNRACYCGRSNCVEAFLSGPGLARTHAELWGKAAASEDIARRDDEEAVRTMALYQHMLARSLAQVVNLLDPAVIVLGGGVSNVAGLYAALTRLIPVYTFSSLRDASDVEVNVRQAQWGDDSGVRGAARLWEIG